ncbi:hypothetical protein ES332_A11G369200v1 [Gossypium tomentosum]|uniref:Uncharacterized protein n=1 Tax=Gossypium tomentosum TaxID=34277 RepID=A0A5D2NNP4_GOSTO|nr:hypothetical protein ES332_A11G369200v1 [Gossypium tomentosum]
MSSTEEGGGTVGAPGGAVSTDQTITTNTNPLDTIIPMPGKDFTLSDGDLKNLRFQEVFQAESDLNRPTPPQYPTFHGSEMLKLRLAAHFVENIGVNNEILYKNIKTEINGLRKCYDPKELEKYSIDDEKLAWMLFVDGCAILQAVYMRYGKNYNLKPNELFIKNQLLTFVYSDLFLLENQIPFRVLELLTSSSKNGEKFMKAIRRFIDDTVITPADMKEPQSHQQDSEWWPQQEGERIHLLHLLRQPNKNKGAPFTHLTFNRFFFVGNLWLPPITVDDSTMNLIAYEMCPDFYNNFTVTSYMCFLDSLIDEAEDVKALRRAGILYNGLGSDEEVAKLFNKMNTDLVPSPMIYSYVEQKIDNHCKNMWINYAAKAYHTLFRSPWTCLAFVAAIAALYLSALHTYYTIHQPK